MPLSCPFCSDSELSWEGGSYVCTSCGAVVERNCLVGDEGVRGSAGGAGEDFRPATARERQAFACRRQKRSISEGLSGGIKVTRRIAQCLECKPGMTGEAVELFQRIYKHPHFNARQSVAKRALSACSVYIVCRQHGWPITLDDVCQCAGCTAPDLLNWKKKVVMTFDDLTNVHPPDLFELIDFRCKKSGLTEKVHQTAVELLALCRDLWISEGRKPDNIINAACYLAWQAEEPVSRVRVKLMDFCRLKQLTYSKDRMSKYVRDIRATLCKLAEQIPWVLPGSINDRTVMMHLADILSFRSSLIVDARRHVQSTLEEEDRDDDDNESEHSSEVGGNAVQEITNNPSGSSIDTSDSHKSTTPVTSETSHLEHEVIQSECASLDSSVNNASCDQDGVFVASSQNIVDRTAVPVETKLSHKNMTCEEQLACSAYGRQCHNKPAAVSAKKKRCRGTDMLEPNWPTWPKQIRSMENTDYELEPAPVTHPDIDAPELSSYDIPDSQLHFYIKNLDK